MKANKNINRYINLKAELIATLKANGINEGWILPHLKSIGFFNFRGK